MNEIFQVNCVARVCYLRKNDGAAGSFDRCTKLAKPLKSPKRTETSICCAKDLRPVASQFIFVTGGLLVKIDFRKNDSSKQSRQFLGNFSYHKSEVCLPAVHRYDLARNKWQELPDLLSPRSHHASCAIGSSLYVFCGSLGSSGKLTGSIERLSNATDSKISAISGW